MNIVIVHCHFERGGVTQVVENHVRWLSEQTEIDRIVLLSGERTSGLSEFTRKCTQAVHIRGFDYDSINGSVLGDVESRIENLHDQWDEEMRAMGLSPHNCVVHWHNHSLGKNVAAPGLIARLADRGWRLLLQVHDFAEDNRPENYLHLIRGTGAKSPAELDRLLYPVAEQIRYATLTKFDAQLLSRIGIPLSQTHCLPNSVTAASNDESTRKDPKLDSERHLEALGGVRRAMGLPEHATWCLYPVRGIRRKNVGELLMLSRFAPPDCYTGLTLRPTTPLEQRSYERWRRVAQDLAPRLVFDAAHHPDISYADNLAASRFVISTSVAEGFGMAFLEPWLAGREVMARRLPSVTDDFESAGVDFSKLYDSLEIPGQRSWVRQCHEESADLLRRSWREVPEIFRPIEESQRLTDADAIDFAQLTPLRQQEVLTRCHDDAGFDSDVRERSHQLIAWMNEDPNTETIARNAEVVGEQYSLKATGQQLEQIYGQLLNASAATDQAIGDAPRHRSVGPTNAGQAVHLIQNARPLFPCRMETLDDETP